MNIEKLCEDKILIANQIYLQNKPTHKSIFDKMNDDVVHQRNLNKSGSAQKATKCPEGIVWEENGPWKITFLK